MRSTTFFTMLQPIQQIPSSINFSVEFDANLGAGARIQFPDVPQIRNRLITGLVSYSALVATVDQDGNGSVISAVDAANMFVTLQDHKGFNFVSDMPYNFFNSLAFRQAFRAFVPPRIINLQKSYLTMQQTTNSAGYAMFTAFYFNDENKGR